jgi:hypothetical protein
MPADMTLVLATCLCNRKGRWKDVADDSRTSCEADASQVTDEQSKADANRRDERGAVLLGCEHKDGEDQQHSQEHLDEESAGDIRV